MNRTYLRQLLTLNTHQLLITAEGFASAMIEAFPLVAVDGQQPTSFFFDEDPPTYKETSQKALSLLLKNIVARSELQGITITDNFSAEDLPEGSIAYHRIWGFITADCRWYFSSKQFECDLLEAEANPAITCHLLHVNSPGGEAWYLDRLSETMRSLSKPIVSLVEQYNCSASYYITCHSSFIASLTANDTIGCIGTMLEAFNYDGWFEKFGIKRIVARASKSDLKNKKSEDLLNGKTKQYIKEDLDPLNEQFLSAVLAARPQLSNLPEDDPVFRGETFSTPLAIEKGLIDASMTFIEAIAKAIELGNEYAELEKVKKSALNYL
ncbi:S49 family peptidase [Bacteroides clarus]|jgi:ClpP class serine protease|uniref:S49 family peptidase n=1 Tax=Bacteroides clarus TaxID=626929 RepID=UPI0018AACE4A|nr:S49 family peptidase [Bacteroides clarus]MCQ1546960.1 S49 family peptidase [Bacteroides clarus]